MLKTFGRFVYDPVRKDFKKQHKQRTLIVQLPYDDLDLYYQWFLRKRYGTWVNHEVQTQRIFNEQQTASREITLNVPGVFRPMWGKHVTVVKGDEYIKKEFLHLWKKYEGQKVDIMYDPSTLRRTWKFWSVDVKSERLTEIRKELGLNPNFQFHITVCRESENEE